MPRPRKVSQTQIARDLGISQALVSLALNGRKNGINPKTYQRIWDRALELGYTPKGMEIDTALAARRTRQAGFILRSPLRLYTQSNFFSHVQHGLHEGLTHYGCTATFLGSEDELTGERFDKLIRPGDALMGIALLGEVKLSFLNRLRKRQSRIVAISATYPGFCDSVTSNETQAVELLVDHLVELGHTRLGWFGGNVGMGRHTQRKRGLELALEAHGLTIPPSFWFDEPEGEPINGANCVARLLESTPKARLPTAIVCFNGMMARAAINAFHKAGIRVPDDISVVAVDRTRIVTSEHPFITGASAVPEKMGEAAAKILVQKSESEDEAYTDLVLPATLEVAESSGPPRR
ncbi:MAG: LacI family transcriptional regulator [Verrucomicrobia bacterium]|nr:MAG: LacI family transcriptional regulator [Verrucomicrobiota bacterium]